MVKTNYSVARVVTYTKQNIGKAERHNERKNTNYSNINVDSEQTKNNVYYKTCNTTYNERLKELVDENKISLRGLKDNAKVFDELVLDINSDYFEKHGGYNFAKRFYEEAFHFAKKEYGKDNIISAVMHADELNLVMSDAFYRPIYHYHLHIVALIWFKKNMYLKPLNFIKEIDNTTYAVRTYFNSNTNENITEKVERIILKR